MSLTGTSATRQAEEAVRILRGHDIKCTQGRQPRVAHVVSVITQDDKLIRRLLVGKRYQLRSFGGTLNLTFFSADDGPADPPHVPDLVR